MTFVQRDLKDVANLVARKLEEYMNHERRETRFQPAGCYRTTKKMQNYDLLSRVMETSDLDYIPQANMKRKKSPGRRSPRQKSPEGKVKKMLNSRRKDCSKDRDSFKKHKAEKISEKEKDEKKSDTDKRGEMEKRKESKIVKRETWMRLIDAKPDNSSDTKVTIVPKLEQTSRTVVAKKEAARLSEYASHVFEEQPLDKLHVIHRYRPNSMDIPHITENGKVQNYTCHFGSALHAKKYVDYYIKEGLQTGKKEHSKRLQQLKTRDTSDKGSDRSSVQTSGSVSIVKKGDYRDSDRSRGKLPPIHSSSTDLVSPRSDLSVYSSDSAMSGFSRYTSSSFNSGLPSMYKIVSPSHCLPSTPMQPCPPTRRSCPEPHPPPLQLAVADAASSSTITDIMKIPSTRQAFAEIPNENKTYTPRSMMLDRASSTTDLLPKLDICTQTPREMEKDLCVLESIASSDTFFDQETQTPRSSIHSNRKKKRKKKHHYKEKGECSIDLDDEDKKCPEQMSKSHSRHMGVTSVSDISRTDNEDNIFDENISTSDTHPSKESRITKGNAKMCQTSFSLASEDCYPIPNSDRSSYYSPGRTHTASMNESLLLQSVDANNECSSLPNSTVHLYKSSQDPDRSDSVFDSEGQNSRYTGSDVQEEHRADVGSSEDYYSYDRVGEKVPEDQQTDVNLNFEHLNELDDEQNGGNTPCQSVDDSFLETKSENGTLFDSNEEICDVEIKSCENGENQTPKLMPLLQNDENSSATPGDHSLIITAMETPRNEEILEADPPAKPAESDEAVVQEILSESLEEVSRGVVEVPAVDEDPRGDTMFSDIDVMKEEYLGTFLTQNVTPVIYHKLDTGYKYVPDERGSDGEAFGDSEPETEVYTKTDTLLVKELNDDSSEINLSICRGSAPPKRKVSNASSYCSTGRAVGDTLTMKQELDRPSSRCSQISSVRGSGKSSCQIDPPSRPSSALNEVVLNDTQDLLNEEEMTEMIKTCGDDEECPSSSVADYKTENSKDLNRKLSLCSRGSGSKVDIELNTTLRGQDGQKIDETIETSSDTDTQEIKISESNEYEILCTSSGSRGTPSETAFQKENDKNPTICDDIRDDKLESEIFEEESKTVTSTEESEHASEDSYCRGIAGTLHSDSTVSTRGTDEDGSLEHVGLEGPVEEYSDYGSKALRTGDSLNEPAAGVTEEIGNQQDWANQVKSSNIIPSEILPSADDSLPSKPKPVAEDELFSINENLVQKRSKEKEHVTVALPADEDTSLKEALSAVHSAGNTEGNTEAETLEVSDIVQDTICEPTENGNTGSDLHHAAGDMDTSLSLNESNHEEEEDVLHDDVITTNDLSLRLPLSAHSSKSTVVVSHKRRPQSALPLTISAVGRPVVKELITDGKAENSSTEVVAEDNCVDPNAIGDDSILLNESRGKIENVSGIVSLNNEQREACVIEETFECSDEGSPRLPAVAEKDVLYLNQNITGVEMDSDEITHVQNDFPKDQNIVSQTQSATNSDTHVEETGILCTENHQEVLTKNVQLQLGEGQNCRDPKGKVENSSTEVVLEGNSVVPDANGVGSILLNESRGKIENFTGIVAPNNETREDCVIEETFECSDEGSPDLTAIAKKDVLNLNQDITGVEMDSDEITHVQNDFSKEQNIASQTQSATNRDTHVEETGILCSENQQEVLNVNVQLQLEERQNCTDNQDNTTPPTSALDSERGETTDTPRIFQPPVVKKLERSASVCSRGSVSEDNEENSVAVTNDKNGVPADVETKDEIVHRENEAVCSEEMETPLGTCAEIEAVESVSVENESVSKENVSAFNSKKHVDEAGEKTEDTDNVEAVKHSRMHRGSITHRDAILDKLTDIFPYVPVIKREQNDMTAENAKPENPTTERQIVCQVDMHFDTQLETPTKDTVKGSDQTEDKSCINTEKEIKDSVENFVNVLNFFATDEDATKETSSTTSASQEIMKHMDQMEVQGQMEGEETEPVGKTAEILQTESLNFFTGDDDVGQTMSLSIVTEDQTFLQSPTQDEEITLLQSSVDATNDSTESNTSESSQSDTTSSPESLQYVRTEESPSTQIPRDLPENYSPEYYSPEIYSVESDTVNVSSVGQRGTVSSVSSVECGQDNPHSKNEENSHKEDDYISLEDANTATANILCSSIDSGNMNGFHDPKKQFEDVGVHPLEENANEVNDKNSQTPAFDISQDTFIHTPGRRCSLESRGSQDAKSVSGDSPKISPRGDEILSNVNQTVPDTEDIPQSEVYINGTPLARSDSVASEAEKLSYSKLNSSVTNQAEEAERSEQLDDTDSIRDEKISEKCCSGPLHSSRDSNSDPSENNFVISADDPSLNKNQLSNTDRNEYHLVLNGKDLPQSELDLQEDTQEPKDVSGLQGTETRETSYTHADTSVAELTVIVKKDDEELAIESDSPRVVASVSTKSNDFNDDNVTQGHQVMMTLGRSDVGAAESNVVGNESTQGIRNGPNNDQMRDIIEQNAILVAEKRDEFLPVNKVFEEGKNTEVLESQNSDGDVSVSDVSSNIKPFISEEETYEGMKVLEGNNTLSNKSEQKVLAENLLVSPSGSAEHTDLAEPQPVTESTKRNSEESTTENTSVEETHKKQIPETEGTVTTVSSRKITKPAASSDASQQSNNQTAGHRIILVSENIPTPIPKARVIEAAAGGPRVILVSEKPQN